MIDFSIDIVWPGKVQTLAGLFDSIEPAGTGTVVTLSAKGVALAEKIAATRCANAAKHDRKLKYGFKQDGHREGAFSELAVALATDLPLTVVPTDLGRCKSVAPDIGANIQVRGGKPYKNRYLLVHPDDLDAAPFVLATAEPPSPVVTIHGWMRGAEAKLRGAWTNFGTAHDKCHAIHSNSLHELCELPGGNWIWLHALPSFPKPALGSKDLFSMF